VVVDDLDIGWSSFTPCETDSPLIVDPNAVLSRPVGAQPLQTIAGRNAKIRERSRLIEQTQFAQCRGLDVGRQAPALPTRPDALRFRDREKFRITLKDSAGVL
jgi:hypothetical protein